MALIDNTKKDFSKELPGVLQDSTAVATSSLDNALQNLLAFEKKCRLANDFHCLKEVCLHIVRLCRSQNNWTTLNSMLTLISKRRAQNKLAITAIVDETFSYIEQTPTREIKVALIKTLTDICEGKMYVEGESAKLHMMTALMLEEDGDLTGACNAIQDVHVETYGSLSRLEKSEYIWQQTRFNLLNKDYVRAMIQSRKMNRKTIEEPEFQEVKVKFYRLMVEFYSHEKDTWEISQCFYKIYDTKSIQADPEQKMQALRQCFSYLILSPYDNHQHDMLHRLLTLKDISRDAQLGPLATLFTTKEIIPLPFQHMETVVVQAIADTQVYNVAYKEELQSLLVTRVTQYNIRVLQGYYARITLNRMSQLLLLPTSTIEQCVSEMSSSDSHPLVVKMDRPSGIVDFRETKSVEFILSEWSGSIGSMLALMETTSHLINRENMVNKI